MTDVHCTGCGRPVADQAQLCPRCVEPLSHHLGQMGGLLAELDTIRSRQTATGSSTGGGPAAEHPLPYDPRATDVGDEVRNTITTWVRAVADERHVDLPGTAVLPIGPAHHLCGHSSCARIRGDHDRTDTGSLAVWLLRHVEWMRHQDWAAAVVDDITRAGRRLERLVDLAPPRWYAGPCNEPISGDDTDVCGHDLYAWPDSAEVTCPACGTVYDVAARRAWLVDAAHDHLATASELSALCRSMLGDLVTTAMIRGYAHRGRIAAHGEARDQRGQTVPLYRVGEVLKAAAAAGASRAATNDARRDARATDTPGRAAS